MTLHTPVIVSTVEQRTLIHVETRPTLVHVRLPGIQGPAGPRGEPGPPGPEGGAYEHDVVFAAPADVWEASHPLARQPNITCFTSGGQRIEGDPSYPDEHTVRVTWAVPMAGTLRLT
ncbi:hypothetical protein GCM10010404_82120 [Nonomuraea africana]|uniref:Collagen-like protein n=1 Tax=Nonomuraea africana TaxID=46171 RepID=A0ABR9KX01_9ACTN|nr:hypothetical protein [Nonomuraea africana]MBE1566553.1 hypothetical protein [Nonomuraea africana]